MIQGLCYFMAFGITLFFMFVIGVICDLPKHFHKRNRFMTCAHYYIYMAFMGMVKERKLQFFNEIARLGYLIQDLSLVEQYLNNLTEYSNSAWYWRNRLQILITNKQNKKLKS